MSDTKPDEAQTDRAPGADEPLVDALLGVVIARYGGRIGPEQIGRLRESVRGLREAAAALYAYPLTNADEPDQVFAAYRGEG